MQIRANHLAKLIKHHREKYPMSQREAEQTILSCDSNGTFWSNVERGKCSMPVKYLMKVGETFSIPMNEILDAHFSDFKESVLSEISK